MTEPRRVSFEEQDTDRRVLLLSARLLTDRAIARATRLSVNQVRYRRQFAVSRGVGCSKIDIRNGRGLGKILLAENTAMDAAIIGDLKRRGLLRHRP